MRKRAKNYLITSEKHELVILRRWGGPEFARAFCPVCGDEVDLFSFDAAIALTGMSGRDLARGIETGRIHSTQTSGNHFGVCRRSLEMEKRNVQKGE